MSYYNLTNLTTSDNLLIIIQETNKLSGDLIGFLILIILFIVMMVAFKNFGIRTVMPIIAFILTLISIPLAILELLPDFMTYILIFATAGFVLAGIFINPEG